MESGVGDPPADRARRSIRARIVQQPDVLIWLLLCAGALVFLDHFRSPSTFYFDEWNFVLDRRSGSIDDFLAPHNGHLSLLPVVVYKVALSAFGMNHYRPFRIVGLLVHILVATMIYRYVRARIGKVCGLAAGVIVLLLGSGWQNIFWPFQIGFMGSVLFGVAAWTLLRHRSRRSDVWASIALGACLACSGLGIAVVVGTTALLAWDRRWKRLMKIVGPPTLLYLIWYAIYGESQGSSENITLIPRFAANEAASSIAGIAGRSLDWGRVMLLLLLVLLVFVTVRRRRVSPTIIAPAVCAISNWLLIGYSRAPFGDFAASRYVYVGAALVILIVSELLADFSCRAFACVAPVVAIACVWGNWRILHAGADGIRKTTEITRHELKALQWAQGTVPDVYRPDPSRMPQLSAGTYFGAEAALGSPAFSDAQVGGAGEVTHEQVDRVSIGALAVDPRPSAEFPAQGLDLTVADGVRLTPGPGTCSLLTQPPTTSERKVEISFPAGSRYVIRSVGQPIDVRIRRYADLLPNIANYTIAAGATDSLTIPADAAPIQTWIVDIRSQADMKICNVSG